MAKSPDPVADPLRWVAHASRITNPLVPSTVTVSPSHSWVVPVPVASTAGTPYSRAMTAACASTPPPSVRNSYRSSSPADAYAHSSLEDSKDQSSRDSMNSWAESLRQISPEVFDSHEMPPLLQAWPYSRTSAFMSYAVSPAHTGRG